MFTTTSSGKKNALINWLFGFVIMDLYANLIPRILPQTQLLLWLAYWAGFFALAMLISKFLLQLGDLESLGLQLQPGWLRFLGKGLLIGAAVFLLKYLCYYMMGMFDIKGWTEPGYIIQLMFTALIAMFFSSAINDLLIRGYCLAFCKAVNQMRVYIPLATILYALDDCWNEGFNMQNIFYSAVLGVALSYSVYKTGALWMSIGMHWAGNLIFRAVRGFDGQGIMKLEQVIDGIRFYYVGLVVTALMFLMVYLLLKGRQPKV